MNSKRFPHVSKETQRFFKNLKRLTGCEACSHRHTLWLLFHTVLDYKPNFRLEDLLKGARHHLSRQMYIRTDDTKVYLERDNGLSYEPTVLYTCSINVIKEIYGILESEMFQERMAEL